MGNHLFALDIARYTMESFNFKSIILLTICTISFSQDVLAGKQCSTDPKTTKTQNVVTCTGCKLVMSTLDELLIDPENELAIADALDEVCNYTVASFVEECHFMICTYYDVLIELVVSEILDPETACNFLTLCP